MSKSSEQLFCNVGDTVKIMREIVANKNETIKVGDKYRVIDLIGFGWNLERISGDGAAFLRIINSEMKDYVEIYDKS